MKSLWFSVKRELHREHGAGHGDARRTLCLPLAERCAAGAGGGAEPKQGNIRTNVLSCQGGKMEAAS